MRRLSGEAFTVRHDPRTARHGARALALVLALAAGPTPSAVAAEWEAMRDQQRAAVEAAQGRIAEIESSEGAAADREKRAEKITRDRIAQARAALGNSDAKAEPRSDDGARLAAAEREWGPNGAERRKLAESGAALQRNLELTDKTMTAAIERLELAASRVPESDVPAALARIEAAADEVGERLSARWQREHATREREREQRERELGQRERGVR